MSVETHGQPVSISITAQQFTVQPESVVQAEGLEAVFECLYPGAVSYFWAINGNLVDPLSLLPNVSVGPGGLSISILATSQYDNSSVQCGAGFGFGSSRPPQPSEIAKLEVHG